MQSDQDQPQDTVEAIAELVEKAFGYVPRAPIQHLNDGDYLPRSLPRPVPHLLGMLDAPTRLVAHLAVVHDAAVEVVEALASQFPKLEFNRDAVLFGAATHDVGKVTHPNELTGPGNEHESDGPAILEAHGVPRQLARFAHTHGAWSSQALPLEDLIIGFLDFSFQWGLPNAILGLGHPVTGAILAIVFLTPVANRLQPAQVSNIPFTSGTAARSTLEKHETWNGGRFSTAV